MHQSPRRLESQAAYRDRNRDALRERERRARASWYRRGGPGHRAVHIPGERLDLFEVETMLQYGEWDMPLSRAEKIEVLRRWKAQGRSERSLCAMTGWRPGRYKEE